MKAARPIPGVTCGLYTHCRHDCDDAADWAIGDPPRRRNATIATTRSFKDWTPGERAAFAALVQRIGRGRRFSVSEVATAAQCSTKQAVAGLLGLKLAHVAVRNKKHSAWELSHEPV